MKVYVVMNIQKDIYGIYLNEATVQSIKENLNSESINEAPFYFVEAHQIKDHSDTI